MGCDASLRGSRLGITIHDDRVELVRRLLIEVRLDLGSVGTSVGRKELEPVRRRPALDKERAAVRMDFDREVVHRLMAASGPDIRHEEIRAVPSPIAALRVVAAVRKSD